MKPKKHGQLAKCKRSREGPAQRRPFVSLV
jgi:hypothetical protein